MSVKGGHEILSTGAELPALFLCGAQQRRPDPVAVAFVHGVVACSVNRIPVEFAPGHCQVFRSGRCRNGAFSAQVRHQRLGAEGVAYVDLNGLWILLKGIAVVDQMAYAVALLFRQTALRFEFAGITPFGFVAGETAEGVSDEEWNARDVL